MSLSSLRKSRVELAAALPISTGVDRFAIGVSALKAVPWNTAGKNPLDQLVGPACGTPRGSGMATKAGKLSHSLPNAYETQAPTLGYPSTVNPVLMKFSPGPCVLIFEVMEWMKHISSARLASFGSRSETSLPLCPRGLNSQGLLIRLPDLPWNVTSLSEPGSGVSCRLMSSGL